MYWLVMQQRAASMKCWMLGTTLVPHAHMRHSCPPRNVRLVSFSLLVIVARQTSGPNLNICLTGTEGEQNQKKIARHSS